MTKVTTDQIRKLRDSTGAPVMRVKKVLEKFEGDEKKAEEILKKEGFEKAAKRASRPTSAGIVSVYAHHNQKIVGVVEIFCETDFVARNQLFQNLGRDLSMQVTSMGKRDFEKQDFIKDPDKKVGDLIREVIAKTGENIRVGRIYRVELGSKN